MDEMVSLTGIRVGRSPGEPTLEGGESPVTDIFGSIRSASVHVPLPRSSGPCMTEDGG